jgi:hypothetical protein
MCIRLCIFPPIHNKYRALVYNLYYSFSKTMIVIMEEKESTCEVFHDGLYICLLVSIAVAEKIVVLFFRPIEKRVFVCCYRSSAPFALLPPHSSACVHLLLDTRWQDQQIRMSSSKRVTPDQVALSLLTSSTFTVKPLEHGFNTLGDQYTCIKL